MDRNKLKQLANAARVQTARAQGKTITEIIKSTGLDEETVLKYSQVESKQATNNRPPRNVSKGRK